MKLICFPIERIRAIIDDESRLIRLVDLQNCEELCSYPVPSKVRNVEFSPKAERFLAICKNNKVLIWRCYSPFGWWRIAWMPTFWLTTVFGIGLLWSLFRDRRMLRGSKAEAI